MGRGWMRWSISVALVCLLGSGLLPALPLPTALACYTWAVGQRVGLKQGTQIRDGSGLSLRVHTTVPSDNWQVDIIGGPRLADGHEWWDVSRKNLDSGGTGWIYKSQAGYDLCSAQAGNPSAP